MHLARSAGATAPAPPKAFPADRSGERTSRRGERRAPTESALHSVPPAGARDAADLSPGAATPTTTLPRAPLPPPSRRLLASTLANRLRDTVSEAANGLDAVRGSSQLFPQAPDVGIHRPRVDDALITPHVVEQGIAALDAS